MVFFYQKSNKKHHIFLFQYAYFMLIRESVPENIGKN